MRRPVAAFAHARVARRSQSGDKSPHSKEGSLVVDQDEHLSQAQQRIEQILSAFDALRVAMGDGKVERQLLDEIFRNVHSLKASAQTEGLVDLAKLTHATEDILHAIRIGRIPFDDQILSVLNQTAESFFDLLTDKQSTNTSHLLQQLANISTEPRQVPRNEIEVILSSLPSDLSQSLSDVERYRLHASIAEGASLFLILTSFDVVDFDRWFEVLKDKLNATGELISTSPIIDQDRPDKISFRILYASQANLETIRSNTAPLEVTVSAIAEVGPRSAVARSPRVIDDSEQTRSLRVSTEDLDQVLSSALKLVNLTEDLVRRHWLLADDFGGVRDAAVTLAESLVRLRLTSLGPLLERVERAGYAAAGACGKNLEFVVSGHDLFLDQSVCDAIADPLIHLVRNAVDHGIESAAERSKNGKQPTGTVTIKATSGNGETRIAVEDDGRGIDPKEVEAACIRMGLTHHQFPLSLDECVRILFRPGFSTAQSVSETSGRGVGLDVVETEIERLGGQVRVTSNPGVGSVFEIRLPVTFGLLEVFTLRLGQQRYVIDAVNVVAPETIERDEFREFEHVNLLELLGQQLPDDYNRFSHGLLFCDVKNDPTQDSASSRRICLVLDEVERRERVVIRSLGARASRWFGVAGATELRDGNVALLLDLSRLMNKQT
ncbi:MAG TPA: ATP-binding protein [Pyrinomonadaceae bacterium]|nr:ATP-binding protein [Pyrinomonadaceae bacterium]